MRLRAKTVSTKMWAHALKMEVNFFVSVVESSSNSPAQLACLARKSSLVKRRCSLEKRNCRAKKSVRFCLSCLQRALKTRGTALPTLKILSDSRLGLA